MNSNFTLSREGGTCVGPCTNLLDIASTLEKGQEQPLRARKGNSRGKKNRRKKKPTNLSKKKGNGMWSVAKGGGICLVKALFRMLGKGAILRRSRELHGKVHQAD